MSPYAYVKVSLIDLKTKAVLREQNALESYTIGAGENARCDQSPERR